MRKEDQELVNRYIYLVIRRLPKDQKEDIKLELQELIDDMIEETGSVHAALTKLGDPALLSKKYREDSGYLIGPEYFDTYLWFLKIILLCSLIPIMIVTIFDGIRTASLEAASVGMVVNYTVSITTELFSNLLSSLLGTFGGVTLVFAIMEHQKIKIDMKKKNAADSLPWTPEDLSPLPNKKAVIERKDSIVNIVFITLFCVFLIVAPHFFAIILTVDKETINIPIFNLNDWSLIMPLFVGSLLIGLIDEIVRLVMGIYCRVVMISNLIAGTLQIILSFIILKALPLWNSELPSFFEKFPKEAKDLHILQNTQALSNVILAIVVCITILEMGVTIYKTMRYGLGKPSL